MTNSFLKLSGPLTPYTRPVTWRNTSFTFNNCTLCPRCIYVFCIYLRTNSDLCHLQHKLIGFYSRDDKCLQRVTEWDFKYNGLRFVWKLSMHCVPFCGLLVFGWNKSFKFNNRTFFPTLYLRVLFYLRTNSDFCHLQQKLIGFYSRDEKCLLRGKDWGFK